MSAPPPPLHPYSILGGGDAGEVHSNKVVVDRPEFLFALPPANRRFVTIDAENNHRMYYARLWGGEFRERQALESDENAGPIKLLFVQGLAGTHCNWMPQLAHFASKPEFDVVAVDCRGVGFSSTPAGRFRTSDLAKDLITLIRSELKWENVHLVGFSLGGMTSLEAALHAPELFQSVSLLSTHAGGVLGTMLPPNGIPPFLKTFGSLGGVTALDAGMELLHSKDFLAAKPKHVSPELETQALRTNQQGTSVDNRFKTAWELIQEARKYVESEVFPEIRVEGTLKQITAAVTHYVDWDRLAHLRSSGIAFLVVGGVQDNLVNYLNQPMLFDVLGAKRIVLKEDSGHAVNLHHREEINQVLEEHFVTSKPVTNPVKPMPPGAIHPWVAFLLAAWTVFRWTELTNWTRLRRALLGMLAASALVRVNYGPLYK